MDKEIKDLLKQRFNQNLTTNIETIEKVLDKSSDLVKRDFVIHGTSNLRAVCYFTDGLADKLQVEHVLESLQYELHKYLATSDGYIDFEDSADSLNENLLYNSAVSTTTDLQKGIDAILIGDALVIVDGLNEAIIIAARGYAMRAIAEPTNEQVVRGPRDGFVENLRTNTALLRRRVRDPLFRIDSVQIGKKTKTDVGIAYIKGLASDDLIEEVKARLDKIEIDGILESGYIEELISDGPWSPFPTIQSTERPDKAASSILEGRVVLLIDNTPFTLLMPVSFWQFLQASDDYYYNFYIGSFFRLIRYIAFVISLTFPSIFVMLASFHQEMIPTPLALTIASGREVNPFPVLLEALLMEISFELMREAGLRMPKPIGSAVSIVGSLIIGQAAVQAGLISPFMVIVVALTGIASFAIPNYTSSFAIRLMRFPILIASGTLGLLGFTFTLGLLLIHLISLRSFGKPYFEPFAPYEPNEFKDMFIRAPWWNMKQQPVHVKQNTTRVKDNQIPSPPKKGEDDEE
jgi:hypothetical protein